MLLVLVAMYIAVMEQQVMMFSDLVSSALPYNWDECLTGERSLNYKE